MDSVCANGLFYDRLYKAVESLAAQVGSFTDLGRHIVLVAPSVFDWSRPDLRHGGRRRRVVRFHWAGKLVELQVVSREDVAEGMVYLVRRAKGVRSE